MTRSTQACDPCLFRVTRECELDVRPCRPRRYPRCPRNIAPSRRLSSPFADLLPT
jgi:hypothetical protein